MLERTLWHGKAFPISFSGVMAHPPYAGRLIVATATAPGAFLGPYMLSAAWTHFSAGEWWTVWNKGTNSFTYADADGQGFSQVLAQGDVLRVWISTIPGAVQPLRWFGHLLARKT